MFAFFDLIVSIVSTVISYIVHGIEMIFFLLQMLVNGVAFVFDCLAYIPAFLLPFVTVIVVFLAVTAVLKIMSQVF